MVWYDDPDDPVWHERLLLWPSRPVGAADSGLTRWTILTPDGDVYWKEMNCDAGKDVTKVSQLQPNGSRPFLEDPIWAFVEPLSSADIEKSMKEGFALALAEAERLRLSLPRFEHYVGWEGPLTAVPAELRSPVRAPKGGRWEAPASAPLATPPGAPGFPDAALPGAVVERAWFLASPATGRTVGHLVPFKVSLWLKGSVALVEIDGGPAVALVEDLAGRTAEAFLEEKKKLAAESLKLTVPVEPEDMRTLGVEKNSRGRRHKPFNKAVSELVEDAFEDWPLRDNIRTFLWLVEKMESDGLGPTAWVEAYLARKKFGDNDRAAHELRSMGRTIETSLCYDQLNGASLCCLEHVARRFQLIIGAHAENSQQPNYVGADYYLEEGGEVVAPGLKDKVAKKLKDDAQSSANMKTVRELKTKEPRAPYTPKVSP